MTICPPVPSCPPKVIAHTPTRARERYNGTRGDKGTNHPPTPNTKGKA